MKEGSRDQKRSESKNECVKCGRCGAFYEDFMISMDEYEGILLCRMCRLEEDSCGCSDDPDPVSD